MVLYNPRDLNDAYQLKCLMRELTLVMHKQHSTTTVNLVTLYFQLTLLPLSMCLCVYVYFLACVGVSLGQSHADIGYITTEEMFDEEVNDN